MANTTYRASAKGTNFVRNRGKGKISLPATRLRNAIIIAGSNGKTKDKILDLLTKTGVGATKGQARTAFAAAKTRGFLVNSQTTRHLKRVGRSGDSVDSRFGFGKTTSGSPEKQFGFG